MIFLKPSKGRLLIAEPSILGDLSFNRSIILLTEHDKESSIGFIINKPLKYSLQDLIPEINCDFKIYQGGPVDQDNLYFIHKIPDLLPNSIEVTKGLYWGGDFKELSHLLNQGIVKNEDIRFFLGYSGWGKGQLNTEWESESWLVAENKYQNIFNTQHKTLWKENLMELGGKYLIWANAPVDPSLN
ncbi:YqgE/AlgH family protein [Wenyingzhuangia sp. 2_MG-2023]|uniref:YqgE/AlgH family protein n=1 Tax=Wenyingzhuangia sp. 2_MG-2023 TaxID=3062639 RepID=UPI0026E1B47F|nr:YqgE/AlgH family protein [Wenyingzhuangia sp. 2_MG-2023]MDO6738405.1 YqgE/AlgH family protein [Wenyingzhuangia sp. 2_MG-2023]MDO6803372.1 YqgE/AlgH family protein [Wenyingzhuangia sp. 1_MG-2023]